MGLNINPVQLYCPNCGCKLTGFRRDDGAENSMHKVQSKYFQQAEVQKRNQPENIFKLTIQYLRLPALVRVGAEKVHQGKSRKEASVNVRKA